jgi:phosphoribosylformimino-5-aminoimidazole carboxamide ribotide isomerase
MMKGPNLGLYKKIKSRFPNLKINASGGISTIDDIKELQYLKLHGVIIGKAIYEGRFNLADLKKYNVY